MEDFGIYVAEGSLGNNVPMIVAYRRLDSRLLALRPRSGCHFVIL